MENKDESEFFTETLQTIPFNNWIAYNFICYCFYKWVNEKKNNRDKD